VAKILDGKVLAEKIKSELKTKATVFQKKHGRKCGLAVVLVGNDPASEIYVANKEKACEAVGIASIIHKCKDNIKQDKLLELISSLNSDKNIDGVLVQLPLPKHLDSAKIVGAVAPAKDVDGFCAANVGNLSFGAPCAIPCTARGCLELVKSTGIKLAGAHAVVIGRSNIVGKPVAQLLLNNDCTVTVTHSKTRNLADLTRTADILVAAAGCKHLVTADMVKPGAVVIDIGITRADGKIFGDVDFDRVRDVAGYITPVPGGVGPMTVAMLLKNVLETENHI
jgi:methylenetetrahydrofolate dehydrogenase (NADP+)/methenyltetrahydrofolate cyclohydrolase